MNPSAIRQLLDWWNNMPQSEKAECDALSVINAARRLALEEAQKPKNSPQRQDSVKDQLHDVAAMADKMGCCDAADVIRNGWGAKEKLKAPASLVEELNRLYFHHPEYKTVERFAREMYLSVCRYRPARQTDEGDGYGGLYSALCCLGATIGLELEAHRKRKFSKHGIISLEALEKTTHELLERFGNKHPAPNPAKPVEPLAGIHIGFFDRQHLEAEFMVWANDNKAKVCPASVICWMQSKGMMDTRKAKQYLEVLKDKGVGI